MPSCEKWAYARFFCSADKEVTGVKTNDLAARLTALLEPAAVVHDLELVAVEIVGGKGTPVVRVLMDRDGGIDIDSITNASRWISELFDAEDPIAGAYTLEVSSPGIDRPLVKPADFERFVGENVHLKVTTSEKRKSWQGVLLGMEGDDVVLEVEGERVKIPYDTVQKARLKGVVDFGKERGAV
jgi:ribosome maturation factor RimP